MKTDQVLPRLTNMKKTGEGWSAQCPAHEDEHNSLSVKDDAGRTILHCHAGCSFESIKAALNIKAPRGEIVARYVYQDEARRVLYRQCRTEDKGFFFQRATERGDFVNGLGDARKVLYKLPELLESDPALPVFIVEGEKDADSLSALQLIATTNPGGAGKWRGEYNDAFKGRIVYILPDNDKPGRDHAAQVARALHAVAAATKIVELPGLPEKGDVSDWLAAGGTPLRLLELADATPEYAPAAPASEDEQKGSADLLDIVRRGELFRTPFGDTYASFKSQRGHVHTCPIDSQEYRHHLTYEFMQRESRAPRKEELSAAINAAQGLARFEGDELPVYTRLAHCAGRFYLDLSDDGRRAVEISGEGWQIISADDAPVKFRRPRGMLALPLPVPGGDVHLLRRFVNVASEEDFILVVAWLVAALRGDSMKFPVLSLTGEQGSAKSTISAMLRSLIDPNVAPLRNSVRNQWDATLAASNSWCVALNNLSELPQWLSDTLCCVADGIGFAARTHHSMTEETLFQAARPIIVNGITDIATRADLLDRSVCLHLPAIPKDKRLEDAALFSEFERARPMILGGLLNGACAAIRNLPSVNLSKLPRMADFAKWATAAEAGLGLDAGAFMAAYRRNRSASSDAALEASPVATALLSYVREHGEVTSSLKTLLTTLTAQFGEKVPADFPKTGQKFAAELRRCAPHLREAGLTITETGDREGGRGSKMMSFSFLD